MHLMGSPMASQSPKTSSEYLVFVHLSDLHIRGRDLGTVHDLDSDLRNELVRDLENLREVIPPISAILITGDIAFAGKEEEYAASRDWLRDLCERLGLEEADVRTVPGNHDIDRGVIQRSPILRDIQARFRQRPRLTQQVIDGLLRDYLAGDPAGGPLMLSPLANYNELAGGFKCSTTPATPAWKADFTLNDGSTLRLTGINSALISNEHDDDGSNRLVVGSAQATLRQERGVAHAVLCHHPPDWLLDQDEVEDLFNERAIIQLFGHKHRARSRRVGNSLRLYAGALHPSRWEEGWDPRYNVLTLRVEGTDRERRLLVRRWERQWSQQLRRFASAAPSGSEEVSLTLEPWTRPAGRAALPSVAHPATATQEPLEDRRMPAVGDGVPISEDEDTMGIPRAVIYQFFELPYHVRMEVVLTLKLLQDEDRGTSEQELFERVLARVEERQLQEQFRQEIEQRHA